MTTSPSGDDRAELDAVERVYPPTDGPNQEGLAMAARAFHVGDFGTARTQARRALSHTPTAAETAYAQQILYRTGLDPVALAVGIACFVLFVAVVCFTFHHGP